MAGQILSRNDVITIIGTALSKVWQTSKDLVKPVYPKFLNKMSSEHARLITYPVGYFGEVPQKAEGAGIQYDQFEQGTALTIDPKSFALGFRMTRETIEDMAKNPFGDFSSAELVSVGRIGKAFRASVAQTQDLYAAQVILQGNSATTTTNWQGAGWDSKALYASDHPILKGASILGATTYSNLGAASSLSQAALQTMLSTFETVPTLEGLVRPLRMKYKLVVGPANRMTAYTVTETTKMNKLVGSFDHDVPGLSDFDIECIVNPFLGSTSTRYALFSDDAQVGYWIAKEPVLEDEEDFETKGHKWSVYFRYNVLHTDSFGTMLSLGA